jgi:hypothetical protein
MQGQSLLRCTYAGEHVDGHAKWENVNPINNPLY